MKVTAIVSVLAFAFLSGACEKQSYSETRAFTHHGEHGASAGHGKDAGGAGHEKAPAEKQAAH